MVDSSGLLGMALAFRASAGLIPMSVDDGGDREMKNQPWIVMNVDICKKTRELTETNFVIRKRNFECEKATKFSRKEREKVEKQ